MNELENEMLNTILDSTYYEGAYNLRVNGLCAGRVESDEIEIKSKEDMPGLIVNVKEGIKEAIVHVPVVITESGFSETVYNDFYIGKDADVVIVAGCGIHNDESEDSMHDGIHKFFVSEGAHVKYVEKHYGEGSGTGKKILNPRTEIYLKSGSYLEMETSQIKGISDSIRRTVAQIEDNATLIINEKIFTHENQTAISEFDAELNGENSKVRITSRAVSKDSSHQEFVSVLKGNNKCYGHVECDAIIEDDSFAASTPKIVANNPNANLIHEATIGKIAGEELIKLMTLGLTEEEAENTIINGFLK